MKNYNIHLFNRDIRLLEEVIERVKTYISPDKLKELLSDIEEETPMKSVRCGAKYTLSDKIRKAIRASGTATTDDIYNFFSKNNWEIDIATKSRIRSILASFKQRKEVEGNARDGFSFKIKKVL